MKINDLRKLAQAENWILFILAGAIGNLKHIGYNSFQEEEYAQFIRQVGRAVEFMGKAYVSLQTVQRKRMEERKKK